MLKSILKSSVVRRTTDFVFSPLTLVSAIWYKYVRTGKVFTMPVSEKIFMKVGILPVRDHYYQPMINPVKQLSRPLNEDRAIPGINWNNEEQLQLLKSFSFSHELKKATAEKTGEGKMRFAYVNPSFGPGDAEYYYNVIRYFKPRKIIEIGCGHSTLLALEAEKRNQLENPAAACKHICIEPYEMPWLEQLKVEIHRKKVEDLDPSFFNMLEENDILFIDSSHMIRPQGDVLFEYLQILPMLNPGVLVHVHDIFSPRDYLKEWVVEDHCFWNEQYLLEAFLTCNSQFRIIGALNFLKHHHRALFDEKCPTSAELRNDEPGSFWFQRNQSNALSL